MDRVYIKQITIYLYVIQDKLKLFIKFNVSVIVL